MRGEEIHAKEMGWIIWKWSVANRHQKSLWLGKLVDLIWKQIQSIAGNAPAEEVAPVKEPVVEPVEEVKNIDPLLAPRQAWLQHFEETYGRKPSAEEFTAAKSQNFEFL